MEVLVGVWVAVAVGVRLGTAVWLDVGLDVGVGGCVAVLVDLGDSTSEVGWLSIGSSIRLHDATPNRIVNMINNRFNPHKGYGKRASLFPHTLFWFFLLFTFLAGDLFKLGLAEGS